MAIEPAFMQVISKNIDYSKNEVELKLFETQIKNMIKKIGHSLITNLEDVVTRTLISDKLFADIKSKQEGLYTVIESYVNEIKAYATANNITIVPSYTTFTYTYSSITASNIEYNDLILDNILNEIMNNEGYFWERRLAIRDMLNYIRTYSTTVSHILNGQEHYPDSTETLDLIAIDYYDLILDNLINYTGGEEIMLLKQKTATVAGTGTATITLAADEILYSVDSIVATGNYVWGINNGAAIQLGDSSSYSNTPYSLYSKLDNGGSSGGGYVPKLTGLGVTAYATGTAITITATVQKIITY